MKDQEKRCDLCGSRATVYVTLLKNGIINKISYCKKHALESGVFDVKGYGLIDEGKAQLKPSFPISVSTQCSHCSCSIDDFQKRGRLGCPHCYETFVEILRTVLDKIHHSHKHIGKTPNYSPSRRQLQHQLIDLKQRLSDAIRIEDYEEAAKARDEIVEIRQIIDVGSKLK